MDQVHTRRGRLLVGRRQYLGTALVALVAGCLSGPTGGENPENGESKENGSVVNDEIRNEWVYTTGRELTADDDVVLVSSSEEADEIFDFERIERDEIREERRAFVEETDFDRSILLFVASRGPQTSYYLELEDITRADDELHVEIVAEHDGFGGDAVSEPTALVRVEFDDERPDTVTVTVVDGWDEATETTMNVTEAS